MGRPTKLTPETQKRIVDALRIGATRLDAALSAGVSYDSFNGWYNAGKQAKSGRYFQFFQAVDQAEGEARLRYTSVIARAANDGDWRAALEYLKRRDRQNWGDGVDFTSGGEKLAALVEIVEVVKTVRDEH